jgi:hypothetical protein
VRRKHHQEAIMNILFWYLPFAMFSGACDVMLSKSETQTDSKWPAESAKRKRETEEPAMARAA